jgi:hypothetical protein
MLLYGLMSVKISVFSVELEAVSGLFFLCGFEDSMGQILSA